VVARAPSTATVRPRGGPVTPARLAVVVLSLLVLACAGAPSLGPQTDGPASPGGALPPAGGSAAAGARAATHRVVGIVDPDRQGMVAFALKVPVDWTLKQSFTRTWDGAVPTPQIQMAIAAPDGSTHIEFRPIRVHSWSEGPMSENLRAQKRQMGMDPRMSAADLPPMAASTYTRDVMLPLLANEGLVLSNLRNPQEAPEERTPQGVTRQGSVDGTLPNGEQVRVETRLSIFPAQIGSDTYIRWIATPSVTWTTGDLEAAMAHTRISEESVVQNPAWAKAESETAARGYQMNRQLSAQQHQETMNTIQQNTLAMTAAHNRRMADIQRQGEANTARYEDRMKQMDDQHAAWKAQEASGNQQHEYNIDTIRGEQKYVDPTTGETVKVEAGYDNVYRANTGTYLQGTTLLATDAPLDPQQVDWVQLQALSQSQY